MKLLTGSLSILMVLVLQTANAHVQTGGKWVPLAPPERIR
jgi:hypothetical protein